MNTVILLGRIASHLRADTRDAVRWSVGCWLSCCRGGVDSGRLWLGAQEVMGTFAKAMRDPYGHVRLAALRGILATYKLFNPAVRPGVACCVVCT